MSNILSNRYIQVTGLALLAGMVYYGYQSTCNETVDTTAATGTQTAGTTTVSNTDNSTTATTTTTTSTEAETEEVTTAD